MIGLETSTQAPGTSLVKGTGIDKFWDLYQSFTATDLSSSGPRSGEAMIAPAMPIERLGDEGFRRDYGIKYAYVAGAMANGIASAELVCAMGHGGMLGIFGAAGLDLFTVKGKIQYIKSQLGTKPFGVNLIHSPNQPSLEQDLVSLLIEQKVTIVEASAFMDLSLAVVRFRYHGIHRNPRGDIVCPNRVIAKVSRVELARKLMQPPPEKVLEQLIDHGWLSREQADMAKTLPVAQDITAEADSGGHTDNRPAVTLLPSLLEVARKLEGPHMPGIQLRVGAAGGIGTPQSAASAFVMGAAYIVTGTINQACRESGSSDLVRQMLAEADQADVTMAPAADMFEMGIKVQVLKKGTMFPMRAQKLYQLYRKYDSLQALPEEDRRLLEKQFFHRSLDEEWQRTQSFFQTRDPATLLRAHQDDHHKMALVFRSYLGQSSRWANQGLAERRWDFQIWCGAAIGAFNEWVSGSFLADWRERHVVTVALNILYGAGLCMRRQFLQMQGAAIMADWQHYPPQTQQQLLALMERRVLNS